MQASPSDVVFESMCDAAGRSTWQPEQAEENGWIGLIGPCGSVTAFSPVGSDFCSLPLTWHKEQFSRIGGRAGGA